MINYIILGILALAVVMSIISFFAELICKRNSPAGKFFRFFRIRLREIAPMNFCVVSILLLFWGLVFSDDFTGIFAAIIMLFIIMFVLRTEDVIDLTKRRKKAKELALVPMAKAAPLMKDNAPLLKELPEMEPMKSDEDEDNEEKDG
ncbi:MAG: hypothetical protein IJK31_11215 [Ruminococcus sp.]|nr:hypothetical protein [Ruminococcus sp.]HRR77377.1 hypothetical protein [Ruminococcus sp.]